MTDMPDRLTDAEIDAIEQRFAEGRVVNVTAQRTLLAEVRRLQAAGERVRALHEWRCLECDGIDPDASPMCADCYEPWPCPTIAALDGGE